MPDGRAKNGGVRPNSGRKSRAEELGLHSLLETAFTLEDRQAVLQNLTKIAKGDDAKAAVSAATLLFGYAFGKPTEKHVLSGENDGPIRLSVAYEG